MFCSGRLGRIDYIATPRPLDRKRLIVANRKRTAVIDCFDVRQCSKDAFSNIQIAGNDLGATVSQIHTRTGVPNNGTQIVTIVQSQLCNSVPGLAAGTNYGYSQV